VADRVDSRLRRREKSSLALYGMTTPRTTFAEDVANAVELELGGLGICAVKLDETTLETDLELWDNASMDATFCLPSPDGILPQPLVVGAWDERGQLAAMRASLDVLARFEPAGVVCTTGPAGRLDARAARSRVVDGLRAIADHAGELGLRVALEPLHDSMRDGWTTISTLDEALDLIDAAGTTNVGVLADVWHLGESPAFADEIRAAGPLVLDVHISDRRVPTRGWCDRVLPGEGSIEFGPILEALAAIGYGGWYEIEIFSDDGLFGTAYEDSLWLMPALDLVRAARDAFLDVSVG
jgi:sugar phosphate isomerase/epimerase